MMKPRLLPPMLLIVFFGGTPLGSNGIGPAMSPPGVDNLALGPSPLIGTPPTPCATNLVWDGTVACNSPATLFAVR